MRSMDFVLPAGQDIVLLEEQSKATNHSKGHK